MANTGYRVYTRLKKVSDDGNQTPLDINNVPINISGLPQDRKDNVFGSQDYVPNKYVPTVCCLTLPNPFSFNYISDALTNSEVLSNVVPINGITCAADVFVNGNDVQYRINGGNWINGSVTSQIYNNDTLQIKMLSSSDGQQTKTATIQVDQRIVLWNVTTKIQPIYVWGKITIENLSVTNGATYGNVYLRTYKGSSGNVPPTTISQNLYPCTNNNIQISVTQAGVQPNNQVVSMTNRSELLLLFSSIYKDPKDKNKMLINGSGFSLGYVFTGKQDGEMILLQTVTP